MPISEIEVYLHNGEEDYVAVHMVDPIFMLVHRDLKALLQIVDNALASYSEFHDNENVEFVAKYVFSSDSVNVSVV